MCIRHSNHIFRLICHRNRQGLFRRERLEARKLPVVLKLLDLQQLTVREFGIRSVSSAFRNAKLCEHFTEQNLPIAGHAELISAVSKIDGIEHNIE